MDFAKEIVTLGFENSMLIGTCFAIIAALGWFIWFLIKKLFDLIKTIKELLEKSTNVIEKNTLSNERLNNTIDNMEERFLSALTDVKGSLNTLSNKFEELHREVIRDK